MARCLHACIGCASLTKLGM